MTSTTCILKPLVWGTTKISELPTQSIETRHNCIITVTNEDRKDISEQVKQFSQKSNFITLKLAANAYWKHVTLTSTFTADLTFANLCSDELNESLHGVPREDAAEMPSSH
jgi:hypothetical protein